MGNAQSISDTFQRAEEGSMTCRQGPHKAATCQSKVERVFFARKKGHTIPHNAGCFTLDEQNRIKGVEKDYVCPPEWDFVKWDPYSCSNEQGNCNGRESRAICTPSDTHKTFWKRGADSDGNEFGSEDAKQASCCLLNDGDNQGCRPGMCRTKNVEKDCVEKIIPFCFSDRKNMDDETWQACKRWLEKNPRKVCNLKHEFFQKSGGPQRDNEIGEICQKQALEHTNWLTWVQPIEEYCATIGGQADTFCNCVNAYASPSYDSFATKYPDYAHLAVCYDEKCTSGVGGTFDVTKSYKPAFSCPGQFCLLDVDIRDAFVSTSDDLIFDQQCNFQSAGNASSNQSATIEGQQNTNQSSSKSKSASETSFFESIPEWLVVVGIIFLFLIAIWAFSPRKKKEGNSGSNPPESREI